MSDVNEYLDTYWVQYVKNKGGDDEEIVEATQVRAVDFKHAKAIARDRADAPEGCVLVVTRHRASSLVSSPSDQHREMEARSRQNRRRSPQYGRR